MPKRKTIRPTEDVHERLNNRRLDMGMKWDDFLESLLDGDYQEGQQSSSGGESCIDDARLEEIVREVVRSELRELQQY